VVIKIAAENEKFKIQISLDLKTVQQLEIIAKAFKKPIPWIIEKNIEKDLEYIRSCTYNRVVTELVNYFGTKVNEKELRKLLKVKK